MCDIKAILNMSYPTYLGDCAGKWLCKVATFAREFRAVSFDPAALPPDHVFSLVPVWRNKKICSSQTHLHQWDIVRIV